MNDAHIQDFETFHAEMIDFLDTLRDQLEKGQGLLLGAKTN